MKRSYSVLCLVVFAGVMLAACSQSQTDRLVSGLANFNRGVAAVDESIQTLSASLYKNCKTVQSIGQSADDIVGSCSKASPVVTVANAVINSLCQRDQVTNISTAVAATAESISATKSQLAAAKKSCAQGGG